MLGLAGCATPPAAPPDVAPAAPISPAPPVPSPPSPAISTTSATQTNAVVTPAPGRVVTETAGTNRAPAATWLPLESWSQANGWGKPERLRNVPAWTYELRGSLGVIQITAGRRTVTWNGINLELGFTPRLTNGQPCLHLLDYTKTLAPLGLRPAFFERTNAVLVIDPGHGGENYGAKSATGDRYEKEFALDWAFRLERLMKRQGWQVFLTRTNDVDIPLPDRVAFADRVHADLFLSLHFNSTDQPQGRSEQGGIETYCLTPVGMPSTLTRRFDDEVKAAFPNNQFDLENFHVAARLHRSLIEATQRKDRGVRRARFMGVLRAQNRAAVLLEGGYLTQATEADLIADSVYRQKLAQAVATALAR